MSNQITRRIGSSYGLDKYARYLLQSDVVCASNTSVGIPFNLLDESSLQGIITHSLGSTLFNIVKPGLYHIDCTVGLSSNVAESGYRKAFIAASTSIQQSAENISLPMPDPEPSLVSCSGFFRFETGDSFEIFAKHNEVAALNLIGLNTNQNKVCSVSITYFG